MTAPIVIIGSGMAGFAVAREFRKLNTETPLLMITQDDGTSYSKPMLSTGFTKKKSADDLAMANAVAMSEQLNMSVRTRTVVDEINPSEKSLLIAEETLHYDNLVLATGAQVNSAPFLEGGSDKVCSINDLDDYRVFREKLEGKKSVAIIGTGLIGCEYANDLMAGGYDVHLIGPTSTVLETLLPLEASSCLKDALIASGATLHLNQMVISLEDDGDKVCIALASGDELTADLVISAIGLKPNTQLAAAAKIEVNRGIVCDRTLQTSEPDIYAIGDCAEVDGFVLLYVLPLMAGARALAQSLNANITQVSYGVMPVVVKTPVCSVAVLPPPTSEGTWSTESDGFSSTSLNKASDGSLLGFALTGDAISQKQALSKQVKGLHT